MRKLGILAIVIGAVAAIALAGDATASTSDVTTSREVTVTRTHKDTARHGSLRFWAGAPLCERFSVLDGRRYCVVPVIVTNVGDEPVTFRDDRQYGEVNGRWVRTDVAANHTINSYERAAGDAWLAPIAPGERLVCTLAFAVPSGSQVSRVQLRDSWFGGVTIDV